MSFFQIYLCVIFCVYATKNMRKHVYFNSNTIFKKDIYFSLKPEPYLLRVSVFPKGKDIQTYTTSDLFEQKQQDVVTAKTSSLKRIFFSCSMWINVPSKLARLILTN